MSIVRDFDKLKRFNVEQLYDQYQAAKGKATKEAREEVGIKTDDVSEEKQETTGKAEDVPVEHKSVDV